MAIKSYSLHDIARSAKGISNTNQPKATPDKKEITGELTPQFWKEKIDSLSLQHFTHNQGTCSRTYSTGSGYILKAQGTKRPNKDSVIARAMRETSFLRWSNRCGFPHVPVLVDAFWSLNDKGIWNHALVMPNAGKTLDEAFDRPATAHEVESILKQLLEVVKNLQAKSILHGDIKPDNVTVTYNKETPQVTLIDWGHSNLVHANAYIFARSFRPPEGFLYEESSATSDMWAVACTIFEIATGKRLFPLTHTEEISKVDEMEYKKRLIDRLNFDQNASERWLNADTEYHYTEDEEGNISIVDGKDILRKINKLPPMEDEIPNSPGKESFIDLLLRMLNPDANLRITANDALEHPFFTKDGSDLKLEVVLRHSSTESSENPPGNLEIEWGNRDSLTKIYCPLNPLSTCIHLKKSDGPFRLWWRKSDSSSPKLLQWPVKGPLMLGEATPPTASPGMSNIRTSNEEKAPPSADTVSGLK